ncbi:serine/threonine-protein kinase [Dokdonella immobilis]|uniref:Serine/threonine protein kinase n=1 Tax=Dokdonella immobilis TaxID=578942 RepID=A0A1I4ZYX3_9GAMM|nr:serine/threonine-protein kinase [Dokdonella immobilis]SFN55418.1 serine/threonine protein kinase [Dokdonella immobilis]
MNPADPIVADTAIASAALSLFEAALELVAGEREPFIQRATADDPELRNATLALLEAHAASEGFLDPGPPLGRELGGYRLLKSIGSGGMGQVWLAERIDGVFRQCVAIKVLASTLGDPDALRRAEAERQFLASIDHPNIAHVLDGGSTAEGQPYVVMEYVDGAPIDRWCRQQALDPRARVRLFLQVLGAVEAAHRSLIIHRDIKPANVLVTNQGLVKLLDFGIAKSLDPSDAGATRTGWMPMTPQYASPEQLAGRPLTTASDMYSLGLLLHELLTGVAAHRVEPRSLSELARFVSSHAPSRPSERIDTEALGIGSSLARHWRARISGDLDRIVLKALAPEVPRRYGSALAFADDLERWLETRPVSARPGGGGYRLGKFLQRNRLAVGAGTAVVCALAIGLSVAAVQQRRAAEEGQRARQANRFLTDMIARADPYASGKPPTLLEALDRAVPDIPRQFAGQPLLEADVRHAIGRAYLMLERNDAAREQLELAATLRAAEGGTDYARVLDSLAILAWQGGRYAEAERQFRTALDQCEADENGRAQRSEVLNDLSSLLSSVGRNAEALDAAVHARDIKATLATVSPRERAVVQANIGAALDGLGRYDESIAAYREALEIFESLPAPPLLDMAVSLNNLAYVQRETGHIEQAVQSQERAIALTVQAVGPDFPRLAVRYSNLALQYAELGRHADATRAAAEALRLSPLAFRANDQAMGNLYVAVARVSLAAGDATKANEFARKALRVYDAAESVEAGRREKAIAILDVPAATTQSNRRRNDR